MTKEKSFGLAAGSSGQSRLGLKAVALAFVLPFALPFVLAFAAVFAAASASLSLEESNELRDDGGMPPTVAPKCETRGLGALGRAEPAGGVIRIGAPSDGLVQKVFVSTGGVVAAGAPLFQLDDRLAQAEVQLRQSEWRSAQARLEALSYVHRERRAELRAAEARLEAAKAQAADAAHSSDIGARLVPGAALSERETARRRFAAVRAKAQAQQAEAERLRAVAALESLDPARKLGVAAIKAAELSEARDRFESAMVAADRLTVRAPVDAMVIDVDARAGERLGRDAAPAVLLAPSGPLHLIVEIDALDFRRFKPDAVAEARYRSVVNMTPIALRFVSVRPLVRRPRILAQKFEEVADRHVVSVVYEMPVNAARPGEIFNVSLLVNDCIETETEFNDVARPAHGRSADRPVKDL